ncbi:MAG: VOC family protein [Dehalococcoidia bacterium]
MDSTTTITPYLCVHDAKAALAFYRDAFGAVETVRYTDDDGSIGHAEFEVGSGVVMISDEWPQGAVFSPKHYGGTTVALFLDVPDVDAFAARARSHGATVVREPEDQAYGKRTATLIDPFGHRWMVATTFAEPTDEEINANMPGYIVSKPA